MSELRAWLQKSPHPVRVRGRMRDGDDKMVKIGETRSKWRDAEVSLRHCVAAEALDDKGEVLRTWESPEEEAKQEQRAVTIAPRSELAELARIIIEACDASAQRHAEAYRLAFDQQSLLVRIFAERLAALEKAWQRAIMAAEPNEIAEVDPNAPLVAALLPQLLAGLGGAIAQQAQPNGKTPHG